MRLRAPSHVLGLLLMLFSTTMLPPLMVSLLAADGEHASFIWAFVLTLAGGALMWSPVRGASSELRTRDGFLIVTLFWLLVALAGALPLMIGPNPHMSLTDAMFESMSGLTTTGASVLTGIDDLPMSIRYYRQQLNWLGGMGIVVLAVAILPMLGIGGMQLYRAEMPGPMKESKLTPRIADTAKALWYIYIALTAACALAYWAGGMTLFDAVGHSFSTVSTGGFSTHDASMGYFDSPLLDMIGAIFMILAGLNFALHFLAWRGRTGRPYLTDPENVFYVYLLVISTAVVVVGLLLAGTLPLGEALRHGIFQIATFSTNTGLATTAYYQWPEAIQVLLLLISVIGGCAGSTAGGIKVMRFMLLSKQGIREVMRLIHPHAQILVKLGNRAIDSSTASSVWAFFAIYVAVFVLFLLILMGTGLDHVTAFSAVVATINNLGIGIGGVSGGFGDLTDLAKWTLVMSMLMGRLEIFTVLVLFMPAFWRR
jgi:trk system potassium uptake protein TrkH